jgi:shikimate dehydrogenase
MSVRRLAVLGYPVAHSRSPAMQGAALAALGLAEEWEYGAIEVAPAEFEARVRALLREGFVGVNVTVPHKTAALALADVATEATNRIGAANTLVFEGTRIEAHNTDAGGLIASLPTSPRGIRALVLGAGGAARAAVWALRNEGASVDIWNRTASRAQQIDIEMPGVHIQIKHGGAVTKFDQGEYGLIVNTTAVGLRGEDPFDQLPLRRDGFTSNVVVADMVYGEGPSTLLQAAAASGAKVVDGIEILVRQGALSFEIWTGQKPPLDVMRAAAYSLGSS